MSPYRALLEARGQLLWNRLTRESGEAGVAAAGLAGFALLGAMSPPVIGAGFYAARAVRDLCEAGPLASSSWMGTVVASVVVGLGLTGGLLEHQRAGVRDAFRLYPLTATQLLLAELGSSVFDLVALFGLLLLSAMAVGASIAQPRLAPAILLAHAHAFVSLLAVQHLASVARDRVLGGLRTQLRLAVGLGAAGLAGAALWQGRHLLTPHTLVALPGVLAWRGIRAAACGELLSGLLDQALAAAAALLLVALVAVVERLGLATPAPAAGQGTTWTFSDPREGVARLLQSQVLGSRQGLVLLVVPVLGCIAIAVVMAVSAAKIAAAPPTDHLTVRFVQGLAHAPLLALLLPYLVVGNSDFYKNQFGWYAGGMKTLLLAPIKMRDILEGQLRALARLAAGQVLATAAVVARLHPPRLVELAWGLAAATAAFVLLAALAGPVLSARFPSPVRAHGTAGSPLAGKLLPFALTLFTVALLALADACGKPLGDWGRASAMAALAIGLLLLYRRLLPALSALASRQRERLVEELT